VLGRFGAPGGAACVILIAYIVTTKASQLPVITTDLANAFEVCRLHEIPINGQLTWPNAQCAEVWRRIQEAEGLLPSGGGLSSNDQALINKALKETDASQRRRP
jgi:hypothetical protein